MRKIYAEPLSDEINGVISAIFGLLNSRSLFSNKKREIIAQMRGLDGVINVRLLRCLLVLSLDKDSDIARCAGKRLKENMDHFGHEEMKWTDSYFRSSWHFYDMGRQLEDTSIELIAARVQKSEYRTCILCTLTMHENGYFREYALKNLYDEEYPKKVIFFALRANDWVEQVRAVANAGLQSSLSEPRSFESILDSITLFSNIGLWQRSDFRKLQMALRTKLVSLENQDVIIRKFRITDNVRVRRELFKYMLLNTEKLTDTICEGLRTKDQIILRCCLDEFNKDGTSIDLSRVWSYIAKSKSSISRKAGIRISKSFLPHSEFMMYTQERLFDKSAAVRDEARRFMRAEGSENFLKLYTEEIEKSPVNRIPCIAALIEIDEKAPFELVEDYLRDMNAKVRRVSLATLVHLDFEKAKEHVLDFLCSEDGVDSRFAKKLLKQNSDSVPAISMDLAELMDLNGLNEWVYCNVLELYAFFPKWFGLIQLLRLLDKDTALFRDIGNVGLGKWNLNYNRSFINPSAEQIREIKALYPKVKSRLETQLTVYLDGIVEGL